MIRVSAVRAGLLLAVAAVCGAAAPRAAGEVLVSAASSLTDVLQQLGATYSAQSGERVRFNFGPSNTLARQIAAGARVDLFISADAAQMDVASVDIMPGTRVDLLSNRLALVVLGDSPLQIQAPRDLVEPLVRRIAMGDPAGVPVGVYGRMYLERTGVWPLVERKLVPVASARLAIAALDSGSVDAAIVYVTDARAPGPPRRAHIVPVEEGPAILYPAAVLKSGANAEGGRRFLAFLRGETATAAFRKAGYLPRSR